MISVETRGKILIIKLIGPLQKEKLEEADQLIEEKIGELEGVNLLIDLRRYEGASELSTVWQELKLVSHHGDSVEKTAVIGHLDWQKLATLLVSPFTRTKERFFEPDDVDDALEWLRE